VGRSKRGEGVGMFFLLTLTMLTKKELLESLSTLPTEFEAEDAIEKIILLEKIHIGLTQSAEGKVVSIDDAKKRLNKWL
jgi:hypothetical protein